jgi:PhnB protein
MAISCIPANCNSVSAYLIVKDAEKAIKFYERAFHGKASICMRGPGGKGIMHAEIVIGNSTVMISDECPDWGTKSAETLGGSPVMLHLYVEDADATFQHAVDAGCTPLMSVADMFWGDRCGKLIDPFGFHWGIATHVEDVSEDEMQRRSEAWLKQMAEGPSECSPVEAHG